MSTTDGDILLALGRLEGKVDALISQQSKLQAELETLELRMCALERSKAALIGGSAVVATAASYVVSLFSH